MGEAPLLTIAIPTYNRMKNLAVLLEVLLPQVCAGGPVEVLVSDNASSDGTEAMVRELIADGAPVRYEKQMENVGSDRNFLSCFANARGKYFWLCGDDDIICPGSVAKVMRHLEGPMPVDMIYATSYQYRKDFAAERKEDPLGREFQSFTSAVRFARVVNVMFTYISGVIVNRERLMAAGGLDAGAAGDENLVQVHWSLPLLLTHRRSVVIWNRVVAGHVGNAGGYKLGDVFGGGLKDALERLLPGRSDLQRAILGPMLRRWLPPCFSRCGRQGMHGSGWGRRRRIFAGPMERMGGTGCLLTL